MPTRYSPSDDPLPINTPVCWRSSGQWHTGTVTRQQENGCFTLWSEEEQLMSLNVQPENITLRKPVEKGENDGRMG